MKSDRDEIPSGGIRAVRSGFTTIYLIPCRGGYLQVDTGYEGRCQSFCAALEKVGVSPSQIRYLFLTHHHDDHAGFTAELVKKTGAAVIVHRNAVAPLAGGVTRKGDMRAINRRIRTIFAVWSVFHAYVFEPFAVRKRDRVVTGDDDRLLKEIGVDGKILYTPGHNDECISLVLADGRAFVGDAAMNMFRYCGTRHRPPFVKDERTLYESWGRLKAGGAKLIHPAHGKPFGAEELVVGGEK